MAKLDMTDLDSEETPCLTSRITLQRQSRHVLSCLEYITFNDTRDLLKQSAV